MRSLSIAERHGLRRDRGRRPGARLDLPRTAARRSMAVLGRSASTRPRTSSAAKARRPAGQRRQADVERAEIIARRAPTERSSSAGRSTSTRGCDIGSSFLLSEMIAAFLWAQLEEADAILAAASRSGTLPRGVRCARGAAVSLRRPVRPRALHPQRAPVLPAAARTRSRAMPYRRASAPRASRALFHYVPLHSSRSGAPLRAGVTATLSVTDDVSGRLVRLPLWVGMGEPRDRRVVGRRGFRRDRVLGRIAR